MATEKSEQIADVTLYALTPIPTGQNVDLEEGLAPYDAFESIQQDIRDSLEARRVLPLKDDAHTTIKARRDHNDARNELLLSIIRQTQYALEARSVLIRLIQNNIGAWLSDQIIEKEASKARKHLMKIDLSVRCMPAYGSNLATAERQHEAIVRSVPAVAAAQIENTLRVNKGKLLAKDAGKTVAAIKVAQDMAAQMLQVVS